MSTKHYEVQTVDVLPSDQYSRATLVVQTKEGDTVVLWLNREDEPALKAEATAYLEG